MNANHQPKKSQVKHQFAVIKFEVNGVMHTFLPAASPTPGLLRVEVELGKVLKWLKNSSVRSNAAKKLFLETIQKTYASQRPQPKKLDKNTEYWPLRKQDGTTQGSPFEMALLSTQLVNVINAPYIEAGKALLSAFRLLQPAAPAYFETFADFKIRKDLWPHFETERRRAFDAYLLSCKKTMRTPYFPADFKATFDRFEAVWLNAHPQAQAGFIFNTSVRNQRKNARINHEYALITGTVHGKTHSYLPGVYCTPEIFKIEKALSKAVSRLGKASKQAKTLKKQTLWHVERADQKQYRLTFTNAGRLQFWMLALQSAAATKVKQQKIFDGRNFVTMSKAQYAKTVGPMAEEMLRQEAKLYLTAGQSLAEAFRLFETAAGSNTKLLAIFVHENKLPFVLESDRCTAFSAYVENCQEELMTSVGYAESYREALIATFDRLTALWLSLTIPAKNAFAMSL